MSAKSFLTVERVSRNFGGHRVLDQVSLSFNQGTLSAIIGPNGAGKTTLFNLIAGALPPTEGAIYFQEQPIRNVASACAAGIARTFQNVRLFTELTVMENIMTGMGGVHFLPSSLRLPRWVEAERRRMKLAFYLLEDLGIGDLALVPASAIPFGQQRLLEVARALAMRPRLLLLDEPAAGLNATETAALSAVIRRINGHGLSILLVEHDMSLVMNLVERVIVLENGRLIADGTPAEIRKNDQVCAAYLGKTN